MRQRKTSSGFTLIELMVVIVILGIIGTMAFVFVLDKPDEARWDTARLEMGQIHKALGMWAVNHDNEYPETLEEIAEDFPGGKVPLDPFSKQPFLYEPSRSGFLLTCLGKDQAEGGEEKVDRDIRYDERGLLDEE